MSLINEALKKAQQSRSLDAGKDGPASGPGGQGGHARRQQGLSAGKIVALSAGVALAICAAVLIPFFLFHSASTPSSAKVEGAPGIASASTAKAGESAALAGGNTGGGAPLAANSGTPAFGGNAGVGNASAGTLAQPSNAAGYSNTANAPVLNSAAGNQSPANAGVSASGSASPIISIPLSPSTPTPVVDARVRESTSNPASGSIVLPQIGGPAAKSADSAPAKAAGPSSEVQAFINGMKVSGVRHSPSGVRAILNDHIYKQNELVDVSLGLRLTEAADDHLVFTDAAGFRYIRNF